MRNEMISVFKNPREISPSQRILRGEKIHQALEHGSEGEKAFVLWAGIPISRVVSRSELYDAELYENNSIKLRFFQYQDGIDSRFGLKNEDEGRWKGEETIAVMEARVDRARRGWKMQYRFLWGDELASAINDHRALSAGENPYAHLDTLPLAIREEAIAKYRFRKDAVERAKSVVLADSAMFEKSRNS